VPLSCVIVDDNPDFLQMAVSLLEREGLNVIGSASNGADALLRTRELQPDVVLLDIVLGPESGFDVARKLAVAGGPIVILVSTHAETELADLIEASPAVGFVPKSELSAEAVVRLAG
jgi:CheY-like chemotaxis protein